jgi:carboxypeptidase Taq
MPSATSTLTDLQAFKEHLGVIQDLRSMQALMGWDLETYMPKQAAQLRGAQMGTVAKLAHERVTDPKMAQWIDTLTAQKSQLSKTDQALLRVVERDYRRSVKIPAALLEQFVKATTDAHHLWIEAREQKSFKHFEPILKTIIDLNRKMADYVGYTQSPYDALMDEYEPDLTVAQLDPLFESLKNNLVPLLQKIKNAPPANTQFLDQVFASDQQLIFSQQILQAMGFDFNAGRLDLSVHPFTSGTGYSDVRLTTRIHENDLFSCLSSSMHEGGHGLYEQNVDPALARTPLAEGTSLGIHESQSRLWENIIGKSEAFWKAYWGDLQRLFSPQLDSVTLEQAYRAINRVQPSFIRVEADEVTYNLHILVRYEIEKALIEDKMSVADIPEAWNAKYQAYLGITPPDDTVGCLQDVHWSHGSFGYFPTYTLGNLYSAQFYQAALNALPDFESQLAQGNMMPLKNWLAENIHHVGRSETPTEIALRVTGEPLNAQYFTDYLTRKYTQLYCL